MKVVEWRIASLVLPTDWNAGLDQDNVAQLAAQIQAGESLPPIGVDSHSHRVVYGFHRLAAFLRLGATTVKCDVRDYESPEAMERTQLAENLRRRSYAADERRKLLARLVVLESAIAKDDEPDIQSANADRLASRQPGGQPSARRDAIRKVAKATGTSEATVERAVKASEPLVPPPQPTTVLRWSGRPEPDVEANAGRMNDALDNFDRALDALERARRETLAAGHEVGDAFDYIEKLRKRSADIRPYRVCPKCLGYNREACKKSGRDCQGRGYLIKAQANDGRHAKAAVIEPESKLSRATRITMTCQQCSCETPGCPCGGCEGIYCVECAPPHVHGCTWRESA